MFRQDFSQFPIFKGMSSRQLDELNGMMELCHLPENTTIFKQGQVAECIYILVEGEVVVEYKPYDGPPLTVARILPGGVFGWSAALGRDVYTSGASTVIDSVAFRMKNNQLRLLCDLDPDTGSMLLERLASVIAERLKNTHNQILNILSQGIDTNNDCARRINNHV